MKEKRFKPIKGQVDYTNIRWAPVINCVLRYKGKFLLVQRNKGMKLYPSYWNGLSGFLDDNKSLKEKVFQELKEEVGLSEKDILSIKIGKIFDQDEPKYKKTWIVHPVLVNVKTNEIKLDWEAQDYRWVNLKEIKEMKLLPGFGDVLKSLFLKNEIKKKRTKK